MVLKEKTALLVGATGLVGGHLLPILLEQPAYHKVKIFTRRNIQLEHPKLEQIVVDFNQLDQYFDHVQADHVYCCLGTTIKKAGSKEAFRKVDFEYPLAIAKMAKQCGASKFLMVTSIGADSNSSFFYNQVKGNVEEEIKKLGLPSVHLFQPSLLLGSRSESRPGESAAIMVSPLIKLIARGRWSKYSPIQAKDVAAAMYRVGQSQGQGNHVHHFEQMMSK
ncbi:oxidoreductase [Paenibacillus sp. SC116]|uniref:oxidoreductase n=1 Tax=Paenibacillus sp. SC116 TaxID=2968986 RepID=UPI00215A6FC0|nr:oxidoreductase [Paenibacillus sp. SC116]MCR8842253.1 oxidoreductase [Paenibacillus sp. SC116]